MRGIGLGALLACVFHGIRIALIYGIAMWTTVKLIRVHEAGRKDRN